MTKRALQVRWTDAAVLDLEEIITYIAADSPLNARAALGRLRKAHSLVLAPHRGQ